MTTLLPSSALLQRHNTLIVVGLSLTISVLTVLCAIAACLDTIPAFSASTEPWVFVQAVSVFDDRAERPVFLVDVANQGGGNATNLSCWLDVYLAPMTTPGEVDIPDQFRSLTRVPATFHTLLPGRHFFYTFTDPWLIPGGLRNALSRRNRVVIVRGSLVYNGPQFGRRQAHRHYVQGISLWYSQDRRLWTFCNDGNGTDSELAIPSPK